MFDCRLFAFPTRPVCFRPHKISRKSLFQNTLHISPTRSILYTENIANLNKLRISGGEGVRRALYVWVPQVRAASFGADQGICISARICLHRTPPDTIESLHTALEAFVMAT